MYEINRQKRLKHEYSQIGTWECTFRGLDHSGSQPFSCSVIVTNWLIGYKMSYRPRSATCIPHLEIANKMSYRPRSAPCIPHLEIANKHGSS